VAEERKLGTMEGQFCQPVSRWRQLVVKVLFTLVFGVLLGGVMPLLLEAAAWRLGAPGNLFEHGGDPVLLLLPLAAVLAAVGFLASLFTRNFLQALGLAIVILVALGLAVPFLLTLFQHGMHIPGLRVILLGGIPTSLGLLTLLGLPTLAVIIPWAVYGCFCNLPESWRAWGR